MDSLWATAVVPSMPGVRAALLSTVMIAALVLAAAPTPAIEEPLFKEKPSLAWVLCREL